MAAKDDLRKFNNKAKKALFKISSAKQMKELGKLTIGLIHDRTRKQGKGVSKPEGNRTKLKPVSKKYAQWRRKQPDLHPQAAKGIASNLTFTGDMLDNMIVESATKNGFKIGHSTEEDAEKTIHQHNAGRKYLFLGKVEVKQLRDKYNEVVGKEIKKV